MDYYKYNNVDIRIARIFNTYGHNIAKNDARVNIKFYSLGIER